MKNNKTEKTQEQNTQRNPRQIPEKNPSVNPPEQKENQDINLEETSFKMILHGGNARAELAEALKAARAGLFDEADRHLETAEAEIRTGHEAQTSLLQSDEDGARMKANLLFVHAHGHLMNASTEKLLAEEIIILYKKLRKDYLHFA